MNKSELIAALSWIITALAPENAMADDIFEILKTKEDIQVLVNHYREQMDDSKVRQRFFPES